MTRQYVLEAWNEYRRKVIPLGASAAQLQSCRRAFYAGAWMLVKALADNFVPGEEPLPKDAAMMSALFDELEKFGEDVAAGKL